MKKCLYCGSPITVGNEAVWDNERRLLSWRDKHIQFTSHQALIFDLLWNNDFVRYGQIEAIWGLMDVDTHSLRDVNICNIRKALREEEFPLILHTVANWGHGGGYWLER